MYGDVKSQNLKKRKNTKKEINFCTRPPDYCSEEYPSIFLHPGRINTPTERDMRLKEMCADEMPRERMLAKGAMALSNVELLAILLRTGRGGQNVIDMARELLQSGDGSLAGIAEMSIDRLKTIRGLGPSKAVTIAAARFLSLIAATFTAGRCTSPPSVSSFAQSNGMFNRSLAASTIFLELFPSPSSARIKNTPFL